MNAGIDANRGRPHPFPSSLHGQSPSRATGFTLLELLVTVSLVGLVAGIAMTSWHRQVARGWRAQARAEMIAAMLELQRHALATGGYASERAGVAAGRWPRWVPAPPSRPRHRIEARPCPGETLRQCVELRAEPEQPQQPDLDCGTLILRSTGEWLALRDAGDAPVPMPPGC